MQGRLKVEWRSYIGAWGVVLSGNVDNGLKVLFRVSMNVQFYGVNVWVLLYVGQKGSSVRPRVLSTGLKDWSMYVRVVHWRTFVLRAR